MFLGVLEALRARLEGRDYTYVPPMAGLYKSPTVPFASDILASVKAAVARKTDVSVGKFAVPIYFFDADGHPWRNVYPCLTFNVIDMQPRFDTTAIYQNSGYGAGTIVTPVIASKEDIILPNGTMKLGSPRLARLRQLMDPMDYMVEIRLYSREIMQTAMLSSYVYTRFPPRHFIRVPMNDGSYRSWDLIFREYQDLDKREAVVNRPGLEREYARTWTYLVEGYIDNTDTTELVNLMRGITINLEDSGSGASGSNVSAGYGGFDDGFDTGFEI